MYAHCLCDDFFAALVATMIISMVLSKLVRSVGLGLIDRIWAVFGFARGGLVVLFIVVAAGFTALPQQPFRQQALLRSHPSKPRPSHRLVAARS